MAAVAARSGRLDQLVHCASPSAAMIQGQVIFVNGGAYLAA